MQEAQSKINKCTAIYAHLEAHINDPESVAKTQATIKPRSVKRMSTNLTQAPDMVSFWKRNEKHGLPRDSNKDQAVYEQLANFYGVQDVDPLEFHDFLLEFKSLRGDYGLRKNKKLEEKLYPNIVKV